VVSLLSTGLHFAATIGQFGLKLEAQRAPVEVLVIDKAQRAINFPRSLPIERATGRMFNPPWATRQY